MSIEHQYLEVVAACRNPEKLIPDYRGEIRVGDLRDPLYLDRVLTGIDIVCHCAGWTSFDADEATCRKLYLEPTLELINRAMQWPVTRFINLSSLAVTPLADRNNPQVSGQPRRNAHMFNCMLAVEDYLRCQTQERFKTINLRTGIYSGRRLNLGLLLFLLQESPRLPAIHGVYGHLPLVDGRDIGQAFARAALAPVEQGFISLNIIGTAPPEHREVYRYINEIKGRTCNLMMSPLVYVRITNWLKRRLPGFSGGSSWPASLLQLLANPQLDNHLASSYIGYDPQFHWKNSVMESARQLQQAPEITVYSLKNDELIYPE